MMQLTGVNNCGVAIDSETSVVKFIPEPRSKSQILMGLMRSRSTQRMFSGFKSRCAMPFLWRKFKPEAISFMICAASCSEKQMFSWIRVNSGPPLIFSNTRKNFSLSSKNSMSCRMFGCPWQWWKVSTSRNTRARACPGILSIIFTAHSTSV